MDVAGLEAHRRAVRVGSESGLRHWLQRWNSSVLRQEATPGPGLRNFSQGGTFWAVSPHKNDESGGPGELVFAGLGVQLAVSVGLGVWLGPQVDRANGGT